MNNQKFDKFTLDIIKDSLYAIGEEMFIAVTKTAKSPIIYETLDFASALTDKHGNLLTQGNGVTGFIGLLSSMVDEVVQKFGQNNDLHPGDIIAINDPYKGGGSHLSDVGLVMPIFYEGELVAFSANKAHWTEVGGKDPGSWTVDSTEIYQEGLQFPCIKIFNKGEPNTALIELIEANVRFPDLSIGDMWAQVSGLKTGDKRFVELCDKYSKDMVIKSIDRMLETSEAISRREVMKIPDGVYEAEDYVDRDSMGNGPFKVKVKVTINGDRFICDFRGSHKPVDTPINVSYYGVESAAKTIFLAVTNPSQDVNDGVFKPLEIVVDDESILNAKRPAPMSTYWETMIFASDLVWKALAPVVPERLTAGHLLSVCGFVFSGTHPDTNEAYVATGPSLGGWGAGKGKDGENAQFCIGDGETFNVPVEILETRYGIFVEEYRLRTDGAGAGEYRGGTGVVRSYKFLCPEASFTGTFGRFEYSTWGLSGGKEGSRNMFEIVKADGTVDGPFGKYPRYPLNEGDTVRMITASGGGYGNPYHRPVDKVILDVKNGFITFDQAHEDYGLQLDRNTLEVISETEERRKANEIKIVI